MISSNDPLLESPELDKKISCTSCNSIIIHETTHFSEQLYAQCGSLSVVLHFAHRQHKKTCFAMFWLFRLPHVWHYFHQVNSFFPITHFSLTYSFITFSTCELTLGSLRDK